MNTPNEFSPGFENIRLKLDEASNLIMIDDFSVREKINHEFSSEDFWFDYRIWCILFKVSIEQINSINQFLSNLILKTEGDHAHFESIIFELENKNPSYQLIRHDFDRFRQNYHKKGIYYPKIPKGFYGIDSFFELIENCLDFNLSDKEYYELLSVLNVDFFPSISNIRIVDRFVLATIAVCEYLDFSYLQGMHEIIGCLAFLKKNPIPINYHIILSIEIINKWAKFLILPNVFTSYDSSLTNENAHNLEKCGKELVIMESENSENAIFGFLYEYFISDKFNEMDELYYESFDDNVQRTLSLSDVNNNNPKMKFAKRFKSKIYKPLCKNSCTEINAIEQILNICNELHVFGCFHSPSIFNEIERSIGANTWCCSILVTCGSSLFIEIENVLLFWLNLIFSSYDIDYKPPYFPKIPSSLQIPTFLIVLLKSFEHQLKNDIYLVCTDRFKLDLDLNIRMGIVSILNPFLLHDKNLEGKEHSRTSIQQLLFDEFIENEKKSLFLDLFQVILAMESLLISTPTSLQRKILNVVDCFNPLPISESNDFKDVSINFIEPKELLYYDNDFSIKNKKRLNGMLNIISGKDIILIDILSSYYIDNVIDSDIERLIRKLECIEELIKLKGFENKTTGYEPSTLFDEELLSLVLLPLLRLCLKTTRIVKIPLEKDKECINNQVISQFLEFASRRQHALLIQQRPCIWIISGPKNKLRDELASKLIANGLIGVQFIDTSQLFNELLCRYYSKNFDFLMIIKDVKSRLCLGNNRPNYKSRALLKISTLKKKNALNESLIVNNAIDHEKNRKTLNDEPKLKHEKQEHSNTYNKIIKFKPNRRKMYYK